MNREDKLRELEALRNKVEQLESELDQEAQTEDWSSSGYYTTFHFLSGTMLGFFGAIASLVFNIMGSIMIKQHPLEIIRIYLTFPLGERALQIDSGAILSLGCCLYLATGMIYGAVLHIILSRFFQNDSLMKRAAVATGFGIALWVLNFYVILSWVQPTFFGGRWIVEMIPVWVGILTHLSFAWTILALDSWGTFDKKAHRLQN